MTLSAFVSKSPTAGNMIKLDIYLVYVLNLFKFLKEKHLVAWKLVVDCTVFEFYT